MMLAYDAIEKLLFIGHNNVSYMIYPIVQEVVQEPTSWVNDRKYFFPVLRDIRWPKRRSDSNT